MTTKKHWPGRGGKSTYSLIRLARENAANTQLPHYPRALVLELAEQLEYATTKLRDQEWDYQWERKQQKNITTV